MNAETPRRPGQRKHGGYPNRLVSYREVFEVLANVRVAVKETRRARGLSLRDVAAQSGVCLNSISRFERGGDMQLSNVLGLLNWLSGEPSTQRAGDLP